LRHILLQHHCRLRHRLLLLDNLLDMLQQEYQVCLRRHLLPLKFLLQQILSLIIFHYAVYVLELVYFNTVYPGAAGGVVTVAAGGALPG
jgi:hypothetical protein